MRIISITRPDDWHVHFRDEEALIHTVNDTATHFARALIMPNLNPALTNLEAIISYRERILTALTKSNTFQPYMTLYLNDTVEPNDILNLKKFPYILGAKLYPAGATTNSACGVKSIDNLYPIFEEIQRSDLVLQVHGEVTYGDIFEREELFINTCLTQIIKDFPRLRIVLEHISTRVAVDFVNNSSINIAATITPQHLMFNRNQLLVGGIKPHYYCLPVLKHEQDQAAIIKAATSGNPKFFAGTDSAPHIKNQKESACGCAGVYSAPFAVAMYAQVFDSVNQLDKLDAFMSRWGAEFYQLPVKSERIEIVEQQQIIPSTLPFGHDLVVPLAAGSTLQWSIHAN